jgi:serine/threonine-protein kinase HipA
LISNTDDHLRNHGYLYAGNQGWRLSPAYDLNPVPVQFRPRILPTLIDEQSGDASIELALSVAEYFRLTQAQARQTAGRLQRPFHDGDTKQQRWGFRRRRWILCLLPLSTKIWLGLES